MKRLIPILVLAWPVAAQERPPAPVVVSKVVERPVDIRRSFVGTVQPVRASIVGSEIEGLVVEYLALEGQRVAKGQPLARLRTRLPEIRRDAARAELTLRKEELAELKNGARPEERAQAESRVEQAEATLQVRVWKEERAKQLFAGDALSEDELKDAALLVRLAGELLEVAKADRDLVNAGPRKERVAQAAARVAIQEAEVARVEDELERHTIRAPFDGHVMREHSQVGQWLGRGDPVAEVAALDEVHVIVPVLEDYALKLKLGTKVPFSVGALPGREFVGELVAVVPRADPRARTFPVKVLLKNPAQGDSLLLKAGMFVTIEAPVGRKEKALLVSKDALVLGGPSPMVYVVAGGAVSPVPVKVIGGFDGYVEVEAQLKPGDVVVVRGNERLQPGQKVAVTETID